MWHCERLEKVNGNLGKPRNHAYYTRFNTREKSCQTTCLMSWKTANGHQWTIGLLEKRHEYSRENTYSVTW